MKPPRIVYNWKDVPLCVDVPWVCVILAITPNTACKLLKNGDLRGIKAGQEWRITKEELQRFLQEGSARSAKNENETRHNKLTKICVRHECAIVTKVRHIRVNEIKQQKL